MRERSTLHRAPPCWNPHPPILWLTRTPGMSLACSQADWAKDSNFSRHMASSSAVWRVTYWATVIGPHVCLEWMRHNLQTHTSRQSPLLNFWLASCLLATPLFHLFWLHLGVIFLILLVPKLAANAIRSLFRTYPIVQPHSMCLLMK